MPRTPVTGSPHSVTFPRDLSPVPPPLTVRQSLSPGRSVPRQVARTNPDGIGDRSLSPLRCQLHLCQTRSARSVPVPKQGLSPNRVCACPQTGSPPHKGSCPNSCSMPVPNSSVKQGLCLSPTPPPTPPPDSPDSTSCPQLNLPPT